MSKLDTKIVAVTVYPDRARVTRRGGYVGMNEVVWLQPATPEMWEAARLLWGFEAGVLTWEAFWLSLGQQLPLRLGVLALAVLYGVTHMPLHRSAVILLFELVVGAVSSLLLTDEVILLREWLGGGLIVIAAYVAAHIHARSEA